MKEKATKANTAGARKGGGIPIYLKLASLFRDQIEKGIWPIGYQIATLPELQAEYGVARATVQQAIQILSEEGLLSSSRGRRTIVIGTAASKAQNYPAYDQLDLDPSFSIEIMFRRETDRCHDLKLALPDGAPMMHVRKRHWLRKTPYSIVDLYIPMSIYGRLPAERDDNKRLYAQLIRDNTGVLRLDGEQIITIVLATQEQAELLDISFATPLARIDAQLVAEDGRQVLANRAFIRADLFMVNSFTGDILSSAPEWRPIAPQLPEPDSEA